MNTRPQQPTTVAEALRLTPAERVALCESLWAEAKLLYPDTPPPVARSFASFDEYEQWRSSQDRPWLY